MRAVVSDITGQVQWRTPGRIHATKSLQMGFGGRDRHLAAQAMLPARQERHFGPGAPAGPVPAALRCVGYFASEAVDDDSPSFARASR